SSLSDLHRDLDSFPTRRSSDLFSASDERGRRQIEDQAPVHLLVEVEIEIVECLLRIAKLRLFPAPFQQSVAATRNKRNFAIRRRSEEHTSELQSHLNLVCRLPL